MKRERNRNEKFSGKKKSGHKLIEHQTARKLFDAVPVRLRFGKNARKKLYSNHRLNYVISVKLYTLFNVYTG